MAVWMVDGVRRLGLGVLPLLALGSPARIALALVVVVTIAGSIARYLRFTYAIDGGELTVQGGVLVKFRRVIPLARIQSVDVVEKLRHKLFGVVELRIEAIGGDSTEANLVALAPGEAERVRDALLAHALEDEGAERDEAAPPLASLGPSELFLAGVTGGRVAVVALLLGYLQEIGPESFVGNVAERVIARQTPGVVVVIAAAVVFILVSLAFSIAATVLVYWGFTVTQEGDRLVIVRGLLERRRATVPLRRIQAVQLQENLIRRAFGLASLTVVVAGYSGPKEEQQETSMLLPIARRAEALALAGRVLGTGIDFAPSSWEPAPPRALLRRLWLPVALVVAAGGAATIRLGGRGALVFALLPVTGLASLLGWRSLAHTVTGGHAAVRAGVLIVRTTIVPLANVQQLKLTASPLQRLHGLATVRLDVPKSTAHAADLDESRARGRFEELTRALL